MWTVERDGVWWRVLDESGKIIEETCTPSGVCAILLRGMWDIEMREEEM